MSVDKLSDTKKIRPFLKWAGGKSRLIDQIFRFLPEAAIESKNISRYCEPFLGSGAVFLNLKNRFKVDQSILIDNNKVLCIVWNVVQNKPDLLINSLTALQNQYDKKPQTLQKIIYYDKRREFNSLKDSLTYASYNEKWIELAALFIFLNKTCYNGLYRVNSKGGFNVPFGWNEQAAICPKESIDRASELLQNSQVLLGDFEISLHYSKPNTLFYLDPPYRPISKTASFTQYSNNGFADSEQERLAKLIDEIDKKKSFFILSNSDPRNNQSNDSYFDDLYNKYRIERIKAPRFINSNGSKRGEISELIITNID